MTTRDGDEGKRPVRKPTDKPRTSRQDVEDVRIDRMDVDWSDGGLPDFVGRLPLRIHQAGNANDLSVQINVAMLPPVDDFRGYESAAPGTASYLMRAADQQRRHRFEIEAALVRGSELRRNRGQLLSAGLAALGLSGCIALGLYGNSWIAGLLAVVAVGGPLAAQTMAGMIARHDAPTSLASTKPTSAVTTRDPPTTDDKPPASP
jgi:uncharacterized membrane protein